MLDQRYHSAGFSGDSKAVYHEVWKEYAMLEEPRFGALCFCFGAGESRTTNADTDFTLESHVCFSSRAVCSFDNLECSALNGSLMLLQSIAECP
jgi:hypothetical protein